MQYFKFESKIQLIFVILPFASYCIPSNIYSLGISFIVDKI